ncbi:hypothetical protein [Micromonospora peucetia]|uniref:Uncharacterized protein n=1 Tax=Micromonospora peucetia TaxID=47871 RepID=A0A1C6V421_9ACTN|nr:hypothetical protein [Micromonospora peucetia]WSA35285.1 hypothetical protein OIE14_15200 [Micromonospora peucetia]SCL60660.1 hypothetical protein GA0070608_2346 [Micromonospora peucetia]
MPAPVAPADKRSPQLLTVLFWIGVALAPVAALILLVADGNGPLRFAAVLAIMAVVLIGLSIALRADGAGPARDEELLDEIEQLRRELRGEIVAAAQRGNQALDHAQRAQEEAVALRRRLDATSAALAGADAQAGAGRARASVDDAVAGRGRVPGQDDAVPRRGRADRDEAEPAHRRQPAPRAERPAQPAPRAERPAPGPAEYATDGPTVGTAGGHPTDGPAGGYSPAGQPGGYGAERPAAGGTAGGYGAARPAEPGSQPAARPLGVVRHTETVHVTTRHTIVDGAGSVPADRGTRYDGGYPGRWSSGPEEQPWPGEPDHRPRTEQPGDREWSAQSGGREWPGQRDERGEQWDDRGPGGAGGPGWAAPVEQTGRGRSDQPDEAGAESGEYWSQLRAGDRWATVRDDDRGRELRAGERRAEMHADATGTEYRVADRWAAVRRDEPRRSPGRADDGWRGGWSEPDGAPALPAGGVPVPDEWRPPRQRGHQPEERHDAHQPEERHARRAEPEPERYGRRQSDRHGHPPQDDVPRAGGARSADRWR